MQHRDKVLTEDDHAVTPGRGILPPTRWKAIAEALTLSGRELDVVRCILDGCSEESTARVLGISSHTVHTHIDRLHRKLRVGNRAELILRVFGEYVFLVEGRDGHAAGAVPAGPEGAEEAS